MDLLPLLVDAATTFRNDVETPSLRHVTETVPLGLLDR